jgi:uncharacterized protein (UPF0332 family)
MGIAEDLLRQADHLAAYEGLHPSQASLRRPVSTAYYALFHLLVEAAALRWSGSPEGQTGVERGFRHGSMNSVSTQFQRQTWRDWHGTQQAIPSAIRRIASAFVYLQQEERHTADYDNHAHWTTTDVEKILETARAAFQDWHSISTDPMAGNYLLAMLVSKQRP